MIWVVIHVPKLYFARLAAPFPSRVISETFARICSAVVQIALSHLSSQLSLITRTFEPELHELSI